MPVIIRPSPEKVGRNEDSKVTSPEALLRETARAWSGAPQYMQTNKPAGPEARRVIQTSFTKVDVTAKSSITPYGNGFVNGIIRAFEQDLHLTLRPDDVWLAILSQFSFFVNGKAEELRTQFVSHESKMKLTVDMTPSPLKSIDMGIFAQLMTGMIQDNVLEPDLKDWIIPNFTTTTDTDKTVASIAMMGTFKKYFEYQLLFGCGFPSVTLLGERADWAKLRRRIDRLPKYHAEAAEWARLLVPTIDHMVASFDSPDSLDIKDFWLRACHEAGKSFYDISTLSGWITAFCFWDEEGNRVKQYTDKQLTNPTLSGFVGDSIAQRKRLTLGGVEFPLINPKAVPKAFVMAPVILKDVGTGVEYETTMVAGHVGVRSSEEDSKVQPVSGWWMLEDSVKPLDAN
jgi:hypothetical protein